MNAPLDHQSHQPPAEASTFDFDRPELQVAAWVKGKWPRVVQGILYAFAFLASYLIGYAATGNPLKSYATVLAVYVVSVIAHEGGHWLGALLAGRTVIAAQLSWIGLWRLRRGWRVRLSRPRSAAGWVIAVPARAGSSRSRTALFFAGGILANAALATAGGLGMARLGLVEGWMWFVLAAMNLAMLLASLMPHAAQYYSDGLHLIAVARGKRSAKLGELTEHIVARAVAGRVEIPHFELQVLLDAPGSGTIFARYLKMCAYLRSGDEGQARTEAVAAIAMYESLGPQERAATTPLADLIRLELGSLDADAATLRSMAFEKDLHFRAPYLEWRRQALLAAVEGDVSVTEKLLARHESSSENSMDGGTRALESVWRARIRTRLHQQVTTQATIVSSLPHPRRPAQTPPGHPSAHAIRS